MAHQPWHREGLLTGGPMGLGPQAQLAWRDQLNTNVPDLNTMIRQRAMADISGTQIESPSDVSLLTGDIEEDDENKTQNALAAGLSGAGQYVSNIFKSPEPQRYINLGLTPQGQSYRQYRGRYGRSA